MNQKQLGVLSFPVIVAALGYFVDIYDLLLFSIIRIPSLRSLGLNDAQIAKQGLFIINIQMIGLLVGGIIWGILGDKKGETEGFVRFHYPLFYWQYCKWICTNR